MERVLEIENELCREIGNSMEEADRIVGLTRGSRQWKKAFRTGLRTRVNGLDEMLRLWVRGSDGEALGYFQVMGIGEYYWVGEEGEIKRFEAQASNT